MIRRLNQEVSLKGKDYFGRNAKITFYPTNGKGWFWQYDINKPPIQITSDLMRRKQRRLVLKYDNNSLNVLEHIIALRWAGFEGIVIKSNEWPPYFGRSWEYCKLLYEHSRETRENIQWCTTEHPVKVYENFCESRGIQIFPNEKKQLELAVICDYKGLGSKRIDLIIPNQHHFIEKVFRTYTQGWPPRIFYFGWLVSKLLRWPHLDRMNWPQRSKEKTIELFCWHRMSDLLGALSIVDSERMLSARVMSRCVGHLEDLEVVKMARRCIVPI